MDCAGMLVVLFLPGLPLVLPLGEGRRADCFRAFFPYEACNLDRIRSDNAASRPHPSRGLADGSVGPLSLDEVREFQRKFHLDPERLEALYARFRKHDKGTCAVLSGPRGAGGRAAAAAALCGMHACPRARH